MSTQIINTRNVVNIFIETNQASILIENPITVIRFMTKNQHTEIYNIIINGQHDKYIDQIETLILNSFNDKIFISRDKLTKSIESRLAQAIKSNNEYNNKE